MKNYDSVNNNTTTLVFHGKGILIISKNAKGELYWKKTLINTERKFYEILIYKEKPGFCFFIIYIPDLIYSTYKTLPNIEPEGPIFQLDLRSFLVFYNRD